MRYAVSEKIDMSNQEKRVCYPEINNVKHRAYTKGPRRLRNLGNTYYMNALFQYFAAQTSSVWSSSKQLLRKKGRNSKDQVLALLKVTPNTEVYIQCKQDLLPKLSCHNLLITHTNMQMKLSLFF